MAFCVTKTRNCENKVSFIFAAFLSSSMPIGSHSLEIGKEAPLLTFSSSSGSLPMPSLKGKYVLVNFWSPSDPMSRIANKQLAMLSASLPSSQISHVSVCTDSDKVLQSEIMDADGIPSNTISLSANDLTPEVLNDFQISTGHRSFLIDPFGNLTAILPSTEQIKSVIS